MKLKYYPKDSVLFVEDKGFIVISGIIFTRNHKKSCGKEAEITHKHTGGDIVGLGEIDMFSTVGLDNWHIVHSPSEVIWMEK